MKKKVYLCPAHNGRYVPQIAYRKPSKDAVLLTAVGEYPTTIIAICFDAYGNDHLFERDVSCEEELLHELLSCGDNQCPITKLWDLDADKVCTDDIIGFIHRAHAGRGLEIRGEPLTLEELQRLSMCKDDSPFPESDTNT